MSPTIQAKLAGAALAVLFAALVSLSAISPAFADNNNGNNSNNAPTTAGGGGGGGSNNNNANNPPSTAP